ncbi:MAG: hypothetical protein ACFFDN_22850 [Candidatus Hodarchaeota archaeon]
MRKKKILIIGIIFISFLATIRSVRGSHICYIQEFYTDKTTYYNDEKIQINATWYLEYDTGDMCYNQIHIYNETDYLVWFSDPISDLGEHNYIWTVRIQDLNTSFNNDHSIFYIKIYHYWYPYPFPPEQYFLDVIQIETIKRNVTCELEGFKNVIRYGEVLYIKATFYNTTGQNRIELENYQIHFEVSSEGTVTFNRTYITNSSGMIEPISLNKSMVSIGVNILSFTMKNDTFFNDLDYDLSLVVTETKVSQALSESSNKDNGEKEPNPIFLLIITIALISVGIIVPTSIFKQKVKKGKKKSIIGPEAIVQERLCPYCQALITGDTQACPYCGVIQIHHN